MAENAVLQSLMPQMQDDVPHYWSPDSRAEIEFVIQQGEDIIPVEVKAEQCVSGRSLYIRKNTNPNTAFAFPSSICNTIMGYLVVHLPLQNGSNGSYQKNELERPKHLFVRVEKFNEPIASCSECRIMQWAQLIYLCKVSIRATESKSRRIMSAVGTTL